MTITPDYQGLCAEIKTEFPSFNIAKKNDSWFMKLVGLVLGQQFMTSYVTTIYHTVYVPDGWETFGDDDRCSILRHERVHMRQSRTLTYPVYALLYLLILFPVGLSYCRAKLEQQAYAESLQAFADYGIDYNDDKRRAWYLKQFVSSAYGYMWPFPKTVSRWFDEAVARVKA